jgi:hypothetical protein
MIWVLRVVNFPVWKAQHTILTLQSDVEEEKLN